MGGKTEEEHASGAPAAGHVDPAAVTLHDGFAERETEARSGGLGGQHVAALGEGLKNGVPLSGIHSRSRVFYSSDHKTALVAYGAENAALGGEFQSVRKQVFHHLGEPPQVAQNGGQVRLHLEVEGHRGALHEGTIDLHGMLHRHAGIKEFHGPVLFFALEKGEVQENVMEYRMADGRRIYLLAEGRLINLAAAYGHPPEVMDMSFANQALSVRYIAENGRNLDRKVYSVPSEIDKRVAALKLAAMGIEIESLTPEQEKYLHSWETGT